jgi:hypothetical protein
MKESIFYPEIFIAMLSERYNWVMYEDIKYAVIGLKWLGYRTFHTERRLCDLTLTSEIKIWINIVTN